jgi:hypothetical protein
MKKFHIDRLEKLYNFLGTIKPSKFYFGAWGTTDSVSSITSHMNVCGTTACALGWAGSIPEFRKRGLKLVWDEVRLEAWVEYKDSKGNEYVSEDAGAEFFGLTDAEAYKLFIPDDLAGFGTDDMPLSQYRKLLRKFIDRKRRELKVPA